MDDLTHTEALAAFKALARSISAEANFSVGLNDHAYTKDAHPLKAMVWPRGLGNSEYFAVEAQTYRELLASAEAAWAERSDTHAVETIRQMALAIISITADQGECSDAALRATFDTADIAKYGERACVQATEMASNGPFSIVKLSGANDAEAA